MYVPIKEEKILIVVFSCGPPPDAPGPNGAILGGGKTVYLVGATVNYTCPNGLGLNGVPYRTCTASLRWEPFTKVHKCQGRGFLSYFICFQLCEMFRKSECMS